MKNKEFITKLKKLNPEDRAKVTIICGKKCLDEVNYVNGTWEDKNYSCEAITNWRSGELYTEEMTIEELIKLLKKKTISNMGAGDFVGLQMGEASDGSTDIYNIEWSEQLSEEEEETAPSGMDMYWDGDIDDVDYEIAPGGIYELRIDVGDYLTTITE
jgi:hypothetical protein